MNKNTVSKAPNAATPDTPVTVKPTPAATKAAPKAAPKTATSPARTRRVTKTATADAAAKSDAPAKATRVGRPQSAKTAMAKPAVSTRRAAKTAEIKIAPAVPVSAKEKARKAKLIRDSFTMPEAEYAILGKTKKASLKAGFNVKKSELLRIGMALVGQLSMVQLQAALAALMPVKAGRPKKDK